MLMNSQTFSVSSYTAYSDLSHRVFNFVEIDVFDQSRWPEYYDWLTERIIRMRDVMGKRV